MSSPYVWLLAARPKTLLVSVAPVIAGGALAAQAGKFAWPQVLICLGFAVLAQITSNFVNDYADGNRGVDEERLGPARMVASGKISPRAMLVAAVLTMGVALLLGLSLIYWGGWWLIAVGALVAFGAFAYSCGGRWSLSHLGLGDGAVVLFYGVVPVVFTYYVQAGDFPLEVILASVAVGMAGDNLLIVNNYRDMEQDAANGKRTTVVRFGRPFMRYVYLLNFLIAAGLGFFVFRQASITWGCAVVPFLVLALLLTRLLGKLQGRELNRLIGLTSLNVLVYAVTMAVTVLFCR